MMFGVGYMVAVTWVLAVEIEVTASEPPKPVNAIVLAGQSSNDVANRKVEQETGYQNHHAQHPPCAAWVRIPTQRARPLGKVILAIELDAQR